MRLSSAHDRPFGSSKFSSRRQQTSGTDLPLRGIHINISSDPFQHRIPPYLQRLWQESKIRRHLSLFRIRLQRRYQESSPLEIVTLSLGIFFAGLFLLLHVGFFSGKKYQDWQQDHYGRLEEVDLLEKMYPDDGRSLTTAILLFKPSSQSALQQETQNIKPILEQLCQYDMFGIIVVWNNNPEVNITKETISASGCLPSKISIYNSPTNMHLSARYIACASAKTPYCYFQDDCGSVRHLRSLYANFLRAPSLIHGESWNAQGYADSRWKQCFMNEDVRLHTCYLSIGAGTFVSKANVESFLKASEKDKIEDQFKDMYFMSYINKEPYQLQGSENNKPNPNILSPAEKEHMQKGLKAVYEHLHNVDRSLEEENPTTYRRHARSPCQDDRCLFLTNVEVLPDPKLFSYYPHIDIGTFENMHKDYNDASQFISHAYSNAVDGSDKTSWKTSQTIKTGDFIGLDLLMPMRIPIKYRFLVRHPYMYRRSLNLQISFDGVIWIDIHPAPTIECTVFEGDMGDSDPSLLECRFVISETGYRFIRLESKHDMDFAYEVYDFSFSARVKKDTNGQLLDIGIDDGVVFVEEREEYNPYLDNTTDR
ncbi:hypothetical protein CLU79DRAFT_761263 [Phycomyces nitens]|nr:hypothetical protein CLU79DRAFT_761263 [Phycomyces nitens]